MENNNEQSKKFSRIFNADKIVSPEDIVEVLKGIKNIMETFKKDNISLTEETKSTVSELFDKIQSSNAEMLAKAKSLVEEARGNVSKETKKSLAEIDKTSKELKRMMKEVENMKPLDGKDADEQKMVEEVLSKIKLPEYKETVLDGGAEIVFKINELDTDDEDLKIDASHIKNLPEMARDISHEMVRTGMGNVEVYSSTGKVGSSQRLRFTGATLTTDPDGAIKVAVTGGAGGGHTIQDEGTPLTQRTNLNFVGTGVTVTDDSGNDATVVTIDGGGGGISDGDKGDITVSGSGAVWTIDNDVVTYAKLQNISATSRILGRITAGAGDTEELTGTNVKTIAGLATTTTDNAITRYDGTTGNTQNSGVTIDDSNNIDGVASMDVDASGTISFGGVNIITDSAGTTTLSNIDAIDSATEATIEAAIDTLANLTSIQGRTVTLADAGANAIFGWDDVAGAYENLTQAEVKAVIGSASDTATGVVELATAAETTTGTDTSRAVTPDGFAGSDYGKRVVNILVSDPLGSAITTGDGKAYFPVPSVMNGWNLVAVTASVSTVSSSGTVTVQLRRSRRTNATTRSDADMLSTKLTIDVSEYESSDATAAAVIDTSKDDVNTGDNVFVDIDVAGTGAKGLSVGMIYQLP